MDFIFDPSLVLYLPLYELNGASFMSRYAYGHVTAVTGALWTPRGISFDGTDDYIEIPDHNALDLGAGSFTLEIWVLPQELKGDMGFLSKQGVWNLGATSIGYQVAFEGDVVTFDCKDGVARNTLSTPAGVFTVNNYHHIVAVRSVEGDYRKIYVDGIEQASAASVSANLTNAVALRLGYDAGADRRFHGLGGEVRIYNRALTPLEIQRNYLSTKWRYR